MVVAGVVADRFEIDRLAGEGGMGAVYRAWDHAEGVVVALKVLHGDADHQLARFSREAALLSALDHPGIVRFIADGRLPDGKPFIVMEWLEGESLSDRLAREVLTVGETLTLGRHIADALGAAHPRGVTHRDLKPGNVFLVDRSVGRIKVLDFGIARVTDAARELTHTEQMLGTPGYMAPEQMRSSRTASPSADLYSFGCVLFKCLTGRTPFLGASALDLMLNAASGVAPRLSSLRSDVPPALDDLVASMLHGDPQGRPAQVQHVAQHLEAIATSRRAAGAPSWRPPAPLSSPALAGSTPLGAAPGATAATATPGAYPAYQTAGTATPVVAPTMATPPTPGPPAARLGLPIALLAVSLLFLGGGAAGIYFGVLRGGDDDQDRTPLTEPEAVCHGEYCARVRYHRPTRVDPAQQIKLAREAVRRFVPAPRLVSMSVNGMTGGNLDMTKGKAHTAVSFVGPNPAIMYSVAFTVEWLVVVKSPASTTEKGMPEPGCSAKQAWRAAVAAGFGEAKPAIVQYLWMPHQHAEFRPSWYVFDADNTVRVTLDGQTCRLVRKEP